MGVEKLLKELFDYQRFESVPALQSMIGETEERYSFGELSDDVMSALSAAGDPYARLTGIKKRDKDSG